MGLEQADVRNFNPGLSQGWQGSKYLLHRLLLRRVCTSRKLELLQGGLKPRHFNIEFRHSKILTYCAQHQSPVILI